MRDDGTDLDHRLAALEEMGRAADPRALPELLAALNSDNATTRQVAVTALGHIADLRAILPLLECLRDPHPQVRQAAAWALGQIGHGRAVGGLIRALRDPQADVRRTAAWALGRMGGRRALPGLLAAQQDPDADVRRAAGMALGMVGGRAVRALDPTPPALQVHKRRRRWIGLALAGASLTSVIVILLVGLHTWNRSLGPELVTLESQQITPVAGVVPAAGEPICGGPPVMMLLVVGIDAPSNNSASAFTDVIRLARLDFVSPSVTLLAVPRDLWVTIPGLEDRDIVNNRIKTAYAYGNHYAVPGGGPSLLAQTLALDLGLYVDHYGVINFDTFAAAIDAIGGIDIYLPQAVESATAGEPDFPAGWQHMDGQTALRYARFRPDNSSDLARIDRQTEVIAAIREKVFGAQLLAALPDLVNSLQGSVLTDLSPAEVSSLLCLAREMESGDIQTVTIEGPMVTSVVDEYGYERLLPNDEAIRQFVRAFQSGNLGDR